MAKKVCKEGEDRRGGRSGRSGWYAPGWDQTYKSRRPHYISQTVANRVLSRAWHTNRVARRTLQRAKAGFVEWMTIAQVWGNCCACKEKRERQKESVWECEKALAWLQRWVVLLLVLGCQMWSQMWRYGQRLAKQAGTRSRGVRAIGWNPSATVTVRVWRCPGCGAIPMWLVTFAIHSHSLFFNVPPPSLRLSYWSNCFLPPSLLLSTNKLHVTLSLDSAVSKAFSFFPIGEVLSSIVPPPLFLFLLALTPLWFAGMLLLCCSVSIWDISVINIHRIVWILNSYAAQWTESGSESNNNNNDLTYV